MVFPRKVTANDAHFEGGYPLGLDWDYNQVEKKKINEYERSKRNSSPERVPERKRKKLLEEFDLR